MTVKQAATAKHRLVEGRGILPAGRVNFRNCLGGPAKTGRKSLGMSVAQWSLNAYIWTVPGGSN